MAVIAVAGGTGKLGRAIVEALKSTTSHNIKILARKPNDELSSEIGIPVIPADYSNVESLRNLLDDHQIDTVISTVTLSDDDTSQSQLNLIDAAGQSSTTKRFIPSEFGIPYTEEHAALFPVVKGKLAALQRLQSSGLEYTLVTNGFFMDYYGLPKVKSYLQPFVFAVDMANNMAAIPGLGNTPVVFTHTFDVAKFVAALTNLTDWPKRSTIIGDKKTWNEVVCIAEVAKGIKFNVTHDSLEKLSSFQVTELPSHLSMYPFLPKETLQYILAIFGRWTANGDFNLDESDILNKRFPEIKARTIREVMEPGWRA
ncbi:NAD(P)-binding protein [Aspergillus bertholletiae]|uniref:NAD(P)-binding protein n=1 Tax=Aspergillus bertholletiae TaxID=1226010 RepID=A0A5N7ARC2_9EURO|nr:NAD(P)-binding protein [Aspergillus bertholletiae]